MKKEDLITEIKLNLKKLLKFSEVKCGTFVLSDGTNVSVSSSDLEIGADCYMLDDLGNQTPCNDGEYVLQDGRTFTVTSGKISDIKGMTGEKPESGDTTVTTPETMASDAASPEVNAPEVEVEKEVVDNGDLSKRVDNLEAKLDEIINLISQMGDGQNKLNEQMMSSIQNTMEFAKKVGSEPGDYAVTSKRNGFEDYSTKKDKVKDESFTRLKEMMKSYRKASEGNL